MHLCRPSSHVPRLPSFLTLLQNAKPTRLALLLQRAESIAPATQTTLERPKAVRTCGVFACFCHFDIFWLGNVLRATKACTLWTSQHSQLPKMLRTWVFLKFEMCFAPQPRALFKGLNFQKCSDNGVLLTSKSASRHIFDLSSDEMAPHPPFYRAYFWPSRAAKHCKTTVFRDFSIFSCAWIVFLLTLSLLWSSKLFPLFSSFFFLLFSFFFFLFLLFSSCFFFLLSSSFLFFLLSSFFFLYYFFFLLSSFFFFFLLSSSPLFSSLLLSSLLFSDSSHLCCCISPYCRKFDFETSFGKVFLKFWRHGGMTS